MELLILNKKYENLSVLDTMESFIWTERYNSAGDFEIYAPASILKAVDGINIGNYIYFRKAKKYMIIDTIQIDSDIDDGDHVTITGESLESILRRRVAMQAWNLYGNFQNSIKTLLQHNIISPSNLDLKIPDFIFTNSSDPVITSMTIEQQVRGENIYDIIEANCIDKKIGFSILPHGNGGFEFSFYNGKNRSYSQTDLPWVAFTPKLDNFISGNFIESETVYKNVCYAYGEVERELTYVDDDGNTQTTSYTEPISATISLTDTDAYKGLDRKEIFYDAGKLEGTDANGNVIPSSVLQYQLSQKGKEELLKNKKIYAFDGKVDPELQYVYGIDYFLGDVVQVRDNYGHDCSSRIVEVVYSYDDTGERIIPTFEKIEEQEE